MVIFSVFFKISHNFPKQTEAKEGKRIFSLDKSSFTLYNF